MPGNWGGKLGFDLYPDKNMPAKKIVEYYQVSEIKRKKKELSDFLLRLSPLSTELVAHFLDLFYELDRRRLVSCRENKIPYYDLGEIAKIDPGLAKRLKQQATTLVKNTQGLYYSLENLLRICSYYTKEIKSHIQPKILVMLDRFEKLREVEKDVRNLIAHEITTVTEDMVKEASGGWDSEKISQEIKT